MWKRLNNLQGRQPVSPVDTTYNEKHSGSAGLGIDRVQSPPGRGRPPPRPPREDMPPRQSAHLPFQEQPPPPPEHRDSKFRPTSSIYSQPSPNPITTRFSRNQYTSQQSSYPEEEVSPPSSPEFDGSMKKSSQFEPVSPIEEMPDVNKLSIGQNRPPSRPGSSSKGPSSNIPVLRREKRRNQVAAAAANLVTRKGVDDGPQGRGRQAVDPRWDPYSGEITTSDKGKPQSVKPGQFTALRPVHRETGITLGNDTSVSSGQKAHTSFGDRVRRLKSNTAAPVEKPEWQGATRTGRAALVSPVADQFNIPPLNIPPKSSKRAGSGLASPQSGSSTPVSVIRSGDGETSPASPTTEHVDPTIRTVLTNSGQTSPHFSTSPATITPDPVVVNQSQATKTLARKQVAGPTEVTQQHTKQESTDSYEQQFRDKYKYNEISFPSNNSSEPYQQPPSRFSVTTYAPSEAHDSPRPSTDTFDRPPMPTPPQLYTSFSSTQQPSSIVDRQRPKVGTSLRQNVSRKAIPPASPVFISMTQANTNKRASNIAKTLPMTPDEAQSHDLITSLQAQLDDLAHRRGNIVRSIRQMTELMPTDSLVVTDEVRRKREMEKMKIERLKTEEADVRREEHDIGLRLHRAWKRRDKEAVYEPTGLWVRRVTG
ncbi:hypothetical protein L207DRAFT_522133 [Hyaloscypha variabilis F]|uniref:Uncharacterized protein n=1 Tax=Hyaloscypha variabilis (strain UAMH 11265 / GT02V1 / F) TaxID=1149755 RepID=A0A2J6SDI5_HYAVF|nr:hypothetical protein L207DRAFT_522133 [Hyaloscypha variabilis F]